jgi:hypothetical protein
MNVLYILIGALIGIVIGIVFRPFRTKVELLWESICWKYTIPKNYRCIEKLRKVKKGAKATVLNEQYTIVGFIEYQFDGTCYYVPQIRPGYTLNTRREVRWLGFEDEDLYLWAEWDDHKFWEHIKTPQPELPNLSMTYLIDVVKANLQPSFMLNNTEVHIQEVQRGEILILFGEYARFKDRCTRIKLKIAGSDYTIGLIYYHHEPLSPEIFFGKEIECADINFPNNRT